MNNGQIGRLRQFLGNAAQKLAIGEVAESSGLGHEHGDVSGTPDGERSATSVGDKIDFLGRRASACWFPRQGESLRARDAVERDTPAAAATLGKRRCGANWWVMASPQDTGRCCRCWAGADTAYYSASEQRS